MREITLGGQRVALYALDTVVVGSGCAGFNAADTLFDLGRRDIALLTEGVNMGTSRNTGSDKQTYYKLSLCADAQDSVYQLAENLFAGGSVNGDTALAEAAGSVRSFMKLVNLGVPFPTNRYGEYVGYKTDHDPRQRATSCGPLTSKVMTEKLEASVRQKGIPLLDGFQAVRLLVEEGRVAGLVALDKSRLSQEDWGLAVFLCGQVVLATGGPAIAYGRTVYPPSQTGSTGLALEAGAAGCNLQEWQYGLASVQFRWNVSGTYQQVLPRYISVDGEGREREFLAEALGAQRALELVFLKGYQWPFDTQKVEGSSLVDLLVHRETSLGRRAFLDFRQNPQGLEQGFAALSHEAWEYLERSGAGQPTPIQRLAHMNPSAIELYAAHSIDLWKEPLEIALCAQHNNGGLAVDAHWQSTLPGLYVAGEAAGTFGVTRPGGSAPQLHPGGLSAGGGAHCRDLPALPSPGGALPPGPAPGGGAAGPAGPAALRRGGKRHRPAAALPAGHEPAGGAPALPAGDGGSLPPRWRKPSPAFGSAPPLSRPQELPAALKNREMLLTQRAMLSAMELTGAACGSRGSALLATQEGAPLPGGGHPLPARGQLPSGGLGGDPPVPQRGQAPSLCRCAPCPKTDDWFEKRLEGVPPAETPLGKINIPRQSQGFLERQERLPQLRQSHLVEKVP